MVSTERQIEMVEKVKAALRALLVDEYVGEYWHEIIEKSVWTADEDRRLGRGWASERSYCVICTEEGLPGTYDGYGIDFYFRLMEAVGTLVEPVNGAIVGVYED